MKLKIVNDLVKAQPDPFVCETPDGWAMYVTGIEGIDAYFCHTPMGPWEYKGRVFSMEGYKEYWAPCMYYEDGWYYLYFSCDNLDPNDFEEYLHVTKSRSPFGPFEGTKRLFQCFSIDPHVVKTDAGLFLWYCLNRENGERIGTRIFVQKMADPETPVGDPVEKVVPTFDEEIFEKRQTPPHWHTIEGAFWLQIGSWQYVMYSGACFENDTYHIGYCSAKTTEPDLRRVCYEKHTDNGKFVPLMTKNSVEEGVGHHSVILWQGQYYAVYHARDLQPDRRLTVDQRTARICKLHFSEGVITAEQM